MPLSTLGTRFFRGALVSAILLAISSALPACSDTETDSDDLTGRNVAADYAVIRAHALMLAGRPEDAPTRALFLHELYETSGGRHAFPEVALHGALWGHRFLAQTQRATDWAQDLGLTNVSALEEIVATTEKFRKVLLETNRLVFVDTYTNFHFARLHGARPHATDLVPAVLLDPLRKSTQPSTVGPFSVTERRDLYNLALDWEQYSTVSDAMSKAMQNIVQRLDVGPDIVNRILQKAFVSPVVHFAYFPSDTSFKFKNFADRAERIKYARQSYAIAEQVGWPKVASSMADYGTIDANYFRDRKGFVNRLRNEKFGACPGDANGDRKVDQADATLVDRKDRAGDLNHDGVVDDLDVFMVRALYGVSCTVRE